MILGAMLSPGKIVMFKSTSGVSFIPVIACPFHCFNSIPGRPVLFSLQIITSFCAICLVIISEWPPLL